MKRRQKTTRRETKTSRKTAASHKRRIVKNDVPSRKEKISKRIIATLLVFLAIIILLIIANKCTDLPENTQRVPSYAINDSGTNLSEMSTTRLAQHRGESGIHLLNNGRDAFVGRIVSARLAERSIDVQYYIYHQDTVGTLLNKELLDAADRGVRVRLLIDDMDGSNSDDVWRALDAHPNIEVRMFNPFARGHSKYLQFITHFSRVNHRMHSKSFTVDNQIAIVGGRNIGDEYYEAGTDVAFTDLDAMAIGPVVQEVSDEFDLFWNSENAYPISTLLAPGDDTALDAIREDFAMQMTGDAAKAYIDAAKNSALAEDIRDRRVSFSFGEAIVVRDTPDKLSKDGAWKETTMIKQLAPHIRKATEEYTLISPYFVPGDEGTKALCELSKKGVRVRTITNSLVSNDVAAVHAGYIQHRDDLLRCGVEVYELNEQLKKKQGEEFTWLPSLSKSSLHAKAMTIDGKSMFVGSFNFDQRSAYTNNEMGILFHNEELVQERLERLKGRIEQDTFKVELITDEDGDETVRWTGYEDGKQVVFYTEPYASLWQRISMHLMRLLPIDSQL